MWSFIFSKIPSCLKSQILYSHIRIHILQILTASLRSTMLSGSEGLKVAMQPLLTKEPVLDKLAIICTRTKWRFRFVEVPLEVVIVLGRGES